jgi:tetratricopeptide (TPR) repeat protein
VSDRLKLAATLAVLALFGATPAIAAKKKEAAPAVEENPACPRKVEKVYTKPFEAVQKARDAKQWEEMLAKAKEAAAFQDPRNAYENYLLHEFLGIAYASLKQYNEAVPELAASMDSPCYPEAEKLNRTKVLMQLAYQGKDYPTSIKFGAKHYEATGDVDTGLYLANAYYIVDDYPNTKKVMGEVIGKMEESGKKPEESAYRILQSSCLQLKDNDCVVQLIEKLVANYPKPEYWQNLIGAMLQSSKTDKELLNILRLADGLNIMKDPAEYFEMANYAMGQGLPGEAQAILEKGIGKGAFPRATDKDRANRALADAKTAVTLDKSTLDKQDASARAKTTGDSDVKLGAAYLSYGMNDKAVEAIQRGLGKGAVKDTDEAGMLLGMAYLRLNNKEEAAKAFATVSKNPMMVRIAKYWVINSNSGGVVAAG